ncbi:hypothetical protein [Mesorhizobium sp. LNHC209A00]|uniref:hypothetical protein n=1 Tax=Mesorhizobium TaxID=68287 RepID=UPI0003D01329|nr:hypothetical protein [Mesorhizobium sp. LNHC209A00]ESY91933.1 hypothetical protein X738_28075 [Mesorhizobium sp. LNHC209A00]
MQAFRFTPGSSLLIFWIRRSGLNARLSAPGDDLDAAEGQGTARQLFQDHGAFDVWSARWRERIASKAADTTARRVAMHSISPKFIPRNHRIEAMIQARWAGTIEQPVPCSSDNSGRLAFTPFEEILEVVRPALR